MGKREITKLTIRSPAAPRTWEGGKKGKEGGRRKVLKRDYNCYYLPFLNYKIPQQNPLVEVLLLRIFDNPVN